MIKINIDNNNNYHKFLCFLFKKLNWNHFKMTVDENDDRPYYKEIVQIRGFRTAMVTNYCGNRSVNRFYWKIKNKYV